MLARLAVVNHADDVIGAQQPFFEALHCRDMHVDDENFARTKTKDAAVDRMQEFLIVHLGANRLQSVGKGPVVIIAKNRRGQSERHCANFVDKGHLDIFDERKSSNIARAKLQNFLACSALIKDDARNVRVSHGIDQMFESLSHANVPEHAIGVNRNMEKLVADFNINLIAREKHAVNAPAVEPQQERNHPFDPALGTLDFAFIGQVACPQPQSLHHNSRLWVNVLLNAGKRGTARHAVIGIKPKINLKTADVFSSAHIDFGLNKIAEKGSAGIGEHCIKADDRLAQSRVAGGRFATAKTFILNIENSKRHFVLPTYNLFEFIFLIVALCSGCFRTRCQSNSFILVQYFCKLNTSAFDDFAARPLLSVLPADLARRSQAPLEELGIVCAEDLYECIANLGGNWYKSAQGLTREDAVRLVDWLCEHSTEVGEITARFYPPGMVPKHIEADKALDSSKLPVPIDFEAQLHEPAYCGQTFPLSTETLPAQVDQAEQLSGARGANRASEPGSLEAQNDLQAIASWLKARAVNINTLSQYKKEAERFLLWCTLERGKALSSISTEDASLYPVWLEELGRKEPSEWSGKWRLPQAAWIGSKNAPRFSQDWRPFNGPLSVSSRKTALTVVRILFGFLTKTGYLRFNPFDQVSTKVHYLAGEGAPSAFADRSLTPRQWNEVMAHLEELKDSPSKRRMRVILSLGKGLGMRASEIIGACAGWIVNRRIGDEDMTVIEIVGKGDKVRRLPISEETIRAIDLYFETRSLPGVRFCEPAVPLVASLSKNADSEKGISRSGLYRVLTDFFEAAAAKAEETSAADAAKLRAGSTHWLRHTFATTALKEMDINIVQNAMGHASIGTTSRYLTPEEAQIAKAMKKMAPM